MRDRRGTPALVILRLHRPDEFDQELIFQIVRFNALAKLTQIK
jgi:hypothetical protein